jgi:hypothetical protein
VTVPRRHQRTVVLDVATAPSRIAITSASSPGTSASGGVVLSCVTRIAQPPGGTAPAIAMSPPRLTSTPASAPPMASSAAAAARSAASALPVEPRSISTPCGARIVAASASNASVRQPGTRSIRRRIGAARPGSRVAITAKSSSYPIRFSARPIVGSHRPSVARAAQIAAPIAVASSGLSATVSPARRLTSMSSLSGRKRL